MEESSEIEYRRSIAKDLDAVECLIQPHVAQRKLLPRTSEEISALLKTGFSAVAAGDVIGFAAIEIYSPKLAEILCLAVTDGYQGQGVGKHLVEHCLELARAQNVLEVMAISSAERFLRECGFDYTLPDEKRALFYQLRPR